MGIDRRALFSDETELFRTPKEPMPGDEVTIRFRTAKDEAVVIYLVRNHTEIKMDYEYTKGCFDYYQCRVRVGKEPFRYYFEVESGSETIYYTKVGVTTEFSVAQYYFTILPGFRVPEWTRGAIIYQIFVDRFCNGDASNDVLTNEYRYIDKPVRKVENWDALPESFDVNNFYGGDLVGVWEKLDYLESMGVEVIYLNPIFVSPSNHKYDAQDYDFVDPHFCPIVKDEGELLADDDRDNRNATRYITRVTDPENLQAANDYFARFCNEVHRRGMRIILDGVFNHCGSSGKWMNRDALYSADKGYLPGAFESKDSPYRSFFRFEGDEYEGWWGHETLPKLNYEESPELAEYILNVARKWVLPPYSVDGWRLDVAADLGRSLDFNHRFWKRFRAAVKEANPEAVILAEHYGDPASWLRGDEWDTVMNYDAFMEPVTWFLTGMEKHSDQKNDNLYNNGTWFFQTMLHNMSKFQNGSLQCAMNELSNHDHSRFMTRTNRTVGRLADMGPEAAGKGISRAIFKEAVVLLMTWPGAPTIYYGDETGMVGWTDPDNRRTYPWGREDYELIEFHKYLSMFHKSYSCLRTGSVKPLMAADGLIAFARFDEANTVVVAENNSDSYRTVSIPVWETGTDLTVPMTRLMVTWEENYNVGQRDFDISDGLLTVELGPHSAQIFVADKTNTCI